MTIPRSVECEQIVRYYGVVNEPNRLCIVMELCHRGSLYHVMNSVAYEFGWDRVFRVAIETIKGLNYMHLQNPPIVHRDMKSLNILVTENWEVKICDLGLSRVATATYAHTLKKLRSTPVWSPPELVEQIAFSTKSDLYSFGVILWELTYRCIKGKYQRPFAEHKVLHFFFFFTKFFFSCPNLFFPS
jgi:serine/threonine protein kinase